MKDRIKSIRKELRLTQQQLADRLKISRGTLAGYEVGKAEPSSATIALFEHEFGVDTNWLKTGEGSMFVDNSDDEELARLFGLLLRDRPGDFKRRIIKTLLTLDPEEWNVLIKIAESFTEK